MSVSRNNRQLLEEIQCIIYSLKDQVSDIKKDISKIKNTQMIQSMKDKANDDKYKIIEPKASSGWFW